MATGNGPTGPEGAARAPMREGAPGVADAPATSGLSRPGGASGVTGARACAPPAPGGKGGLFPVLCVVLALACLHVFFYRQFNLTGDEVRYAAYGLGLIKGEGFHASDASWQEMLRRADMGDDPGARSPARPGLALIHSVVYPLLGAVPLWLGGLDGARWFSFLVGAAGLFVLHAALRARFGPGPSLAGLAAVAFSAPLAFYMRLFFSEILLFTLNALLVWALTTGAHRERRNALPLVVFCCLLPFVHLKLALVAVAGCLTVFFQCLRRGWGSRLLALLVLTAAGMCALYFVYNQMLFGRAVGGASPAFATSLWIVPNRILVNLLDHHHGLLPNAPHMLLALAGFALALARGERPFGLLGAFFGAYFFTILWANGAEAYACRPWVAACPFLAFGFAYWAQWAGEANRLWALPLLALSMALFCLGLRTPSLFLDGRMHSTALDALFRDVPWLNLAYFLPWDFRDLSDTLDNAPMAFAVPVFAVVCCFAAGQMLLAGRRAPRAGAALQALALATALVFAVVEEVPDVAVTHVFDPATGHHHNFSLARPSSYAFVRFENPPAVMKEYGALLLASRTADGWVYASRKASVYVAANTFARVGAVSVAEEPDPQGRVWSDTVRAARVYRRVLSLP
ncbi:hypothetical protein NNJEOMEG_01823 [Fundidesulfovibrio magnetotacticus]|uniref:Uncharacterized protein n=1 Tax=Fundidesulfovibrio magnetotacticus TaxID=2730080 RepID=A0A6V8M0I5_9BACT|nr:hypothetical protein [Fundidesulfovibrio magnetotacticus]GFK93985.1 hypothetical protein NNJEOMEG_01823 [Fundidesulfovibrio magnetotacticus]